MNRLSLVIALSLTGTAVAAQASVLVVGGGLAQSCYEAAEARDSSAGALDTCNRALTEEMVTPEDRVATHVNRGILYFHRSAVSQAAADFDRALQLDPREPDAWLNKAVLTVKHGNAVEALPMIEQAIALKTRRPALAYYLRGIVQEDRGDLRAAYHDFRKAQSLEPKWREPAVELARFQVRRL